MASHFCVYAFARLVFLVFLFLVFFGVRVRF